MKYYRRMPLHLLVVLAFLGWNGVQSASSSDHDCPDQYLYTQQPPQEIIVCNPYLSGELSLSCGVTGKNVTDIQWWLAPGSVEENATQLTESSKYTLEPKILSNGLEIELTVNNLGAEDVGTYWCQASVEDAHGVQLLSTSESVKLEEESYFDSQFINNKCTFTLRNSDIRCASILFTPPSVTTTLPEPSVSSVASSVLYPSPTPEALIETASQLPTTQPLSATSSSPKAPSSIILYAVLGLVGFLAVVCVLLTVVVVVLCRRKCASRNMKDCSEKDAAAAVFDQFSNQSGYPPVYKHTESTRVIHADMHHRAMSGEYAEIGPALSLSQEHRHSNILLHSSLPPIPTELDPEQYQFQNPGYENPYDLLVFHPQTQTETDDAESSKLQERTEGADSQSLRSHEYHMLEQIAPISLDSTTPATSPQHTYHTLENNTPSSVPSGDDPDATSAYDDIIQREPSQRLSFDSTGEPSRLPTIPENDLENQSSTEYVNVVKPNHPSDAVSPDLSTRVDLKDCTGFSESSKDDGEYDRLIDPPHLYHVLEHSPSLPGCPRIHNFDPTTTYSRLEASLGHSTRVNTHLLPHVHIVSQQADVTNVSDTYSSESSLDATESNVFDDPRYLVGPLGQTRVVKSACSMRDKLKELQKSHSCAQHGQPPTLTHKDKTEAQSDSILMKYSGDYERDPVYMQKLYNGSRRNSSHGENSTSVQQHAHLRIRVMDDSEWCDDSGFATYGSSRFSLQDREKGTSLPNLVKHIYQPLETETLEPLQPYEKLKRNKKETVM